MKKLAFVSLLLPFLFSCVKDKPNISSAPEVALSNSKKVYVVNEGNFGSSNAAISLYDPGTGSCVENIYKSKNGAGPGDVAQSMNYINNNFYVVMNNSGKILVCDAEFNLKSTITGFNSPRYILQVSNSKAYVSDLYANNIKILSLQSGTISGSIACPGWTEQMTTIHDKAFITNFYRNYLYVINTINDTKSDSIDVGPGASSLVLDANSKLWVLSAGNSTAAIGGKLKRIDPLSLVTEQTFTFTTSDYPNNLCLNKTKDTLYYLNNGICKMPINFGALPSSPFIPKGSRIYYGLGVSPINYRIYAADAVDYNQRSNIYLFDVNGNEKGNFKAGVNANGFFFE
jgi:hypothetical protein